MTSLQVNTHKSHTRNVIYRERIPSNIIEILITSVKIIHTLA